MKQVLIICMVLLGLTTYAQRNRPDCNNGSDLTTEQIAELKTKQMTLMLDLSEEQQKKMKKLHLENTNMTGKNNRSRGKGLSATEKYDKKTQNLDSKIAFKKNVKSILTKEQYEKWGKERIENRKNDKGRNDNRNRRNRGPAK